MKVRIVFDIKVDEDNDEAVEQIIDQAYEAIESNIPEAKNVYVE